MSHTRVGIHGAISSLKGNSKKKRTNPHKEKVGMHNQTRLPIIGQNIKTATTNRTINVASKAPSETRTDVPTMDHRVDVNH